jgi:hypothetical protein
MSPSAQDENHAKQVAREAVRSLQTLETIKKDNIKLLLRNGQVIDMNVHYQAPCSEFKVNNDRLIIEAAKEFNDKVAKRAVKIPRGDIWIYRDVLLVTKDRIMMLLANAYRIPSVDVFTLSKWLTKK